MESSNNEGIRGRVSEITVFSLIFAGFYLIFSILFVFVDSDIKSISRLVEIISYPGRFLFSTFLWGAFFVPIYLLVLAYILTLKPSNTVYFVILIFSLIPFLTLSVLLKVAIPDVRYNSTISDFLINRLGRLPAAFALGILLLIEILLLYKLYMDLGSSGMEQRDSQKGDMESPEGFEDYRMAEKEERGKQDLERLSIFKTEWLKLEGDTPRNYTETSHAEKHDDERMRDEIEEERTIDNEFLIESHPGVDRRSQEERVVIRDSVKEDVEDVVVIEKLEKPESANSTGEVSENYTIPVNGILMDYPDGRYWEIDEETRSSADILMRTLEEFKIKAELTGIKKGPVITMFEILPAPGVKISKIVNLSDNIALRLAAVRVRIVAPIPGKHAVGIEIPNKKRNIVSFKELITLPDFQNSRYEIPIALGKDITGEAQIIDLVQTPHLLIAGATGSGKSVCVNSIINSILYKKTPEEVRLLLIDPKIVELKFYNEIPHLLTPVITDPKRAFQALQYCIDEMENRYALLDALGVRDIHSYNRKVERERLTVKPLPYIVIVVDEFADLMATSGREMEATLARLAAMSRAVGIHLVLATQRPSIDVITGLIKANIPSRIAFMVASKFDSRIIIDSVGAEKLLGKGDMLFSAAWNPVPVRIQGAFLSEEEVEAITTHLKSLGKPDYIDEEIFFDEEESDSYANAMEDPLMDKALEIVFAAGKASASFLQRRLKIGYNRAARLIEEMERRGIVGPQNGSKPREILKAP